MARMVQNEHAHPTRLAYQCAHSSSTDHHLNDHSENITFGCPPKVDLICLTRWSCHKGYANDH